VSLALIESVTLGYALVQWVADSESIRVLFLKGLIVERQGLRRSRVPADVDVLVEPDQIDRLVAALAPYGWTARPDSTAPRFFEIHSRSLINDDWPSDIDVHDYYPGLFADASIVFDELWRTHETIEIAGREVIVPDRLSSACILAAHAVRNSSHARSAAELDYLVDVLTRPPADQNRAQIDRLSITFRARETLRPWLLNLGIDASADDLTTAERRSWVLLLSGNDTTSFHWWVHWHQARWWRKPQITVEILAVAARRLVQSPAAFRDTWRSRKHEFRDAREAMRTFKVEEHLRGEKK
jgi:hypothetical protein